MHLRVATVLTVYGIETSSSEPHSIINCFSCNSTYRLRYWNKDISLKIMIQSLDVATALTVYGIETPLLFCCQQLRLLCCNSAYRLRYWNTLLLTTRFAHDFRSSKNIYYLRYWNSMNVWLSYSGTRLQQHMVCAEGGEATESNSTMRSEHLKYLNEVKVKRRW